jgi:hypothetical protein
MGTGTLTIAVSAGSAADYAGNPSIEAATYDVGLANSNVFVGDHGKVKPLRLFVHCARLLLRLRRSKS